MLGIENNPLVIIAFVGVCLALVRGIAIEGARIKNTTARLHASDEDCKEAGSLTLLLVLLLLGAFGVCMFIFRLYP